MSSILDCSNRIENILREYGGGAGGSMQYEDMAFVEGLKPKMSTIYTVCNFTMPDGEYKIISVMVYAGKNKKFK